MQSSSHRARRQSKISQTARTAISYRPSQRFCKHQTDFVQSSTKRLCAYQQTRNTRLAFARKSLLGISVWKNHRRGDVSSRSNQRGIFQHSKKKNKRYFFFSFSFFFLSLSYIIWVYPMNDVFNAIISSIFKWYWFRLNKWIKHNIDNINNN